jgi:hypothetical protein
MTTSVVWVGGAPWLWYNTKTRSAQLICSIFLSPTRYLYDVMWAPAPVALRDLRGYMTYFQSFNVQ